MNVRINRKQKIQVNDTAHIVPVMQAVLLRENKRGQNKEHFWAVGLSHDHQILYIELVSLGSISHAVVNPSEVMEQASAKGVHNLILVHNHPSGNLYPSDADIRLTDRLIQAAKLLHKEVLDHLIISANGYYSFFGDGLIEKLKQSLNYVVPYELAAAGEQQKALEMAKVMLADKLPISKIRQYTRLSKKALEELQGYA